jgi:hypothetical protein
MRLEFSTADEARAVRYGLGHLYGSHVRRLTLPEAQQIIGREAVLSRKAGKPVCASCGGSVEIDALYCEECATDARARLRAH